MKASDYLRQLSKLDRLIDNKLKDKQSLIELAEKVTPTWSHSPKAQGTSDKVGEAVARIVDLEREICEAIDRLVDTSADVLRTIEQLPGDEYDVCHRLYVEQQSIDAAAYDMGKSVRQVHRIRARALKNVQDILDKKNF